MVNILIFRTDRTEDLIEGIKAILSEQITSGEGRMVCIIKCFP